MIVRVCMFTLNMKKPVQVFTYSFQNAASNEVDIHIDGTIVDASTQAMIEAWFGDTTSVSYKSFRNSIDKLTGIDIYNIIINSPGGHVGDALAIYDYLQDIQMNKGKTVNTKGIGIVASSATLLLLAGNSPRMSKNSWFMMHTVSGGIYGTVDQVESYAVSMRKFNDMIKNLYANKSGKRPEEITKMMNAETWLSADEAKEKGFITTVEGSSEYSNALVAEELEYNIPSVVLNSYNASVKPPQSEDMKKLFTDLKNDIINAINGVKPAEGGDQTALINQIADAIGTPFENIGANIETQIETLVTTKVGTLVTTEVGKVIAPYEARIKTLEDANTGLVKKNGELETAIANKLGTASTSNKDEKIVVPIGNFN